MTLARPRIAGPRDIRRLGPLDPREAAWRADLADIALADRIAVAHYARPAIRRVIAPRATLHVAADAHSVAASELLPGEAFAVLELTGGWAWGYGVADHYVGHVRADALGDAADTAEPTHRIGPGDALIFARPDIKALVAATLPAGALVVARPHDDRFVAVGDGFAHRRHLLALAGDPALDWVEVARGYVGAAYRWGGRTRAGIDCSGLVQMALAATGVACRRDSDMQASMGEAADTPARGALACWPGHIGILLDARTLLHANAHWMACVAEPLTDAVARAGAPPIFRRL